MPSGPAVLVDDVLDAPPAGPLDDAPSTAKPKFEYSNTGPGGHREQGAGGDDRIELGVGEVEVAVGPGVVGRQAARHRNRSRIVIAGGVVGRAAQAASSGACTPIGSSSRRTPASRNSRVAAAENDLVIDAIR